MNHGIRTIIYPITDAGRAKGLFGKLLGGEPYVDQPYYVGFRVGEQEIGLLPNGHATGMSGPLGYFHVDDIKKALEALVKDCLLYTSPSPRDRQKSRMPSSA